MRFETIKKMEVEIKNVTTRDELHTDIKVMSQGVEILMEYITEGNRSGAIEAIYMGATTADSYRVRFEEVGNIIKVVETSLSRV